MEPRVREALNVVEDVLLGFDRASMQLWDILTALRSEDATIYASEQEEFDAKLSTTVPIRRAAFPRLATRQFTFFMGNNNNNKFVMPTKIAHWHFVQHAVGAARHLGLIT